MADSMKKLEKLKFWCQKVMPSIYDDSLSYYELLCKIANNLNDVIEIVAITSGDIGEFEQRVLDSMTEFEASINDEVSDFKNDVNADISDFKNDVNDDIDDFKNSVNSEIDEFEGGVSDDIDAIETSVNSAVSDAGEALTIAQNTASLADNTMQAIQDLAESMQIGYMELFNSGGYLTKGNACATPQAVDNAGFILSGSTLYLNIVNTQVLEGIYTRNNYYQLYNYDQSIGQYIPAKFYGVGYGHINGVLCTFVACRGQGYNNFQNGVWFRPTETLTLTENTSARDKTCMVDFIPCIWTTPFYS